MKWVLYCVCSVAVLQFHARAATILAPSGSVGFAISASGSVTAGQYDRVLESISLTRSYEFLAVGAEGRGSFYLDFSLRGATNESQGRFRNLNGQAEVTVWSGSQWRSHVSVGRAGQGGVFDCYFPDYRCEIMFDYNVPTQFTVAAWAAAVIQSAAGANPSSETVTGSVTFRGVRPYFRRVGPNGYIHEYDPQYSLNALTALEDPLTIPEPATPLLLLSAGAALLLGRRAA